MSFLDDMRKFFTSRRSRQASPSPTNSITAKAPPPLSTEPQLVSAVQQPPPTPERKPSASSEKNTPHPLDALIEILVGKPIQTSAAVDDIQVSETLRTKLNSAQFPEEFIKTFLETTTLALTDAIRTKQTETKQTQQLQALQQLLKQEHAGKQLTAALEKLTDRKQGLFHILADAYVYLHSKAPELSKLESTLFTFLTSKPVDNFMTRFVSSSKPNIDAAAPCAPDLFKSEKRTQAFTNQARLYRHRVTLRNTSYYRSNLNVLCGHFFAKKAEKFAELTVALQEVLLRYHTNNVSSTCRQLVRVQRRLKAMTPEQIQIIKNYMSRQDTPLPDILFTDTPITTDALPFIMPKLTCFTGMLRLLAHQKLLPAQRLHDLYADYIKMVITHNEIELIELTTPLDDSSIFNAIKRAQYLTDQQVKTASRCAQIHPGIGQVLQAGGLLSYIRFLRTVRLLDISHKKLFEQHPELKNTPLANYLCSDRSIQSAITSALSKEIDDVMQLALKHRELCSGIELNGLFKYIIEDNRTLRGFEASHLIISPMKEKLADMYTHVKETLAPLTTQQQSTCGYQAKI